MRVILSKTKCNYLAIVLAMTIFSCFLINVFNQNDVDSLKSAVIVQFVAFWVMFLVLGYANKALITLYSVFLVVFYIFQNGQLLLYAVGFDFNYYYVEKFSSELLIQSVLFSNLCMCSAFAAATFSFDEKREIYECFSGFAFDSVKRFGVERVLDKMKKIYEVNT